MDMNDTTEHIFESRNWDGTRLVVRTRWAETLRRAHVIKAEYLASGADRSRVQTGSCLGAYKITACFITEVE